MSLGVVGLTPRGSPGGDRTGGSLGSVGRNVPRVPSDPVVWFQVEDVGGERQETVRLGSRKRGEEAGHPGNSRDCLVQSHMGFSTEKDEVGLHSAPTVGGRWSGPGKGGVAEVCGPGGLRGGGGGVRATRRWRTTGVTRGWRVERGPGRDWRA